MYNNMCKKVLVAAICTTAMTMSAHALELGKPISTSIDLTEPNSQGLTQNKKTITLMNIVLNAKERKTFFNYTPNQSNTKSYLPSVTNLGMNNVPVLDQAQHGTCVTFATTAAIDAALGKQDYVSQLCSLELGASLEEGKYRLSGWDGSWGPWVIEQMLNWGVISMDKQKAGVCAGVTTYPRSESDVGRPMSLDDYKKYSESISNTIFPIYRLNFNDRLDETTFAGDIMDAVFNHTKEALALRGNRLTFGTILILPSQGKCTVGACATHNKKRDTWALTSEVLVESAKSEPNMGGHEMVIVGYDDDATATDAEGKLHRGLFTLRNSWGEYAGDGGNFYMTYDYFKKFVGEVQEIATLKK